MAKQMKAPASDSFTDPGATALLGISLLCGTALASPFLLAAARGDRDLLSTLPVYGMLLAASWLGCNLLAGVIDLLGPEPEGFEDVAPDADVTRRDEHPTPTVPVNGTGTNGTGVNGNGVNGTTATGPPAWAAAVTDPVSAGPDGAIGPDEVRSPNGSANGVADGSANGAANGAVNGSANGAADDHRGTPIDVEVGSPNGSGATSPGRAGLDG